MTKDNLVLGILIVIIVHLLLTEESLSWFLKGVRSLALNFYAGIAAFLLGLSDFFVWMAHSISEPEKEKNKDAPVRLYLGRTREDWSVIEYILSLNGYQLESKRGLIRYKFPHDKVTIWVRDDAPTGDEYLSLVEMAYRDYCSTNPDAYPIPMRESEYYRD